VFAEVREAAQQQGLASIQKLVEIRDNPKVPFIVQIAAANSLLDRGYGRPPQAIAFKDLTPLPDPDTINQTMTTAQAVEAYALTLKQGERDLENLMNGEPGPVMDVEPNEGES
jgi:hypothetical protein